jgi:hypothetical protein
VPPVIMVICDTRNCTRLHLGIMHQAAIPDGYPISARYPPDTRWVRARVQKFTHEYSHGADMDNHRGYGRGLVFTVYSTRFESDPLPSLYVGPEMRTRVDGHVRVFINRRKQFLSHDMYNPELLIDFLNIRDN